MRFLTGGRSELEMSADSDAIHMREALELALLGWGLTNPNPMVGAVLVKNGMVVGRGYHHRAGEAHAEIEALRDAREHGVDPRGGELLVTLEPCSTTGRTGPCTGAIIAAGVRRVVIGGMDPNPAHAGRGARLLREAGIEVCSGILERECAGINYSFFKWIVTGRPFVMLKLATTLDGRIATASGSSRWVTGPEARKRVQRLRRMADAVMVGGGTMRCDRPRLTVREPEDWPRQPLRVIATRRGVPEDELARLFPDGRVETVNLPDRRSWNDFLSLLGERKMVNLLIEGGGELAASALAAGVVDRVEFHIAPKILGGRDSRPAVGGDSPEFMDAAIKLENISVERCGDDVIVSGDPH